MGRAVAVPPKRKPSTLTRVDGMHYTQGHYTNMDSENGDGPVDKLIERGYEVVEQKGLRVTLACPEDQYNKTRARYMQESENRLLPREKRIENLIADKNDAISYSEDIVDRPVEQWGDMVNALPDESE